MPLISGATHQPIFGFSHGRSILKNSRLLHSGCELEYTGDPPRLSWICRTFRAVFAFPEAHAADFALSCAFCVGKHFSDHPDPYFSSVYSATYEIYNRNDISESTGTHRTIRRITWLRGRKNVHKSHLIHVAGHSLGLILHLLTSINNLRGRSAQV